MKKLKTKKLRKRSGNKHFAGVLDNDYEFVHIIAKNQDQANELFINKYGKEKVSFVYPMGRYTENHLTKIDVIDYKQPDTLVLSSSTGIKNEN